MTAKMTKGDYEYLEPIEVSKNIYWVGFYDEKANLHCNPYLLKDDKEVVIFDPGSIIDYPKVASKIFSLVEQSQVDYIVLHHQDPDLCASVSFFEDIIRNKNLKIVTHTRASVLIRYYGIRSDFYIVDKNDYSLTLKSGRSLKFMVTPFLHSPASIVTYDETSKVLFSSDLFGAISKEWTLYAEEGYQDKMRIFHEGYMPSNDVLRASLEKIDRLDINMILPQHGSIIKGEMVRKCIDYLKQLKCGIDLAKSEEELYGWIKT
ncbi:MBL fold metallo-hydrolase [Candidatus Omnitrophota bacterium]